MAGVVPQRLSLSVRLFNTNALKHLYNSPTSLLKVQPSATDVLSRSASYFNTLPRFNEVLKVILGNQRLSLFTTCQTSACKNAHSVYLKDYTYQT